MYICIYTNTALKWKHLLTLTCSFPSQRDVVTTRNVQFGALYLSYYAWATQLQLPRRVYARVAIVFLEPEMNCPSVYVPGQSVQAGGQRLFFDANAAEGTFRGMSIKSGGGMHMHGACVYRDTKCMLCLSLQQQCIAAHWHCSAAWMRALKGSIVMPGGRRKKRGEGVGAWRARPGVMCECRAGRIKIGSCFLLFWMIYSSQEGCVLWTNKWK
jgi:hypothetical protein